MTPNPIWYHPDDGFLFIEPTATRASIISWLMPRLDQPLPLTKWLAGTVTVQRRIQRLGKRETRDWRIGCFLMWRDGEGARDLGLSEYGELIREDVSLDELIVWGRLCAYQSPRIDFRQFGVRARMQQPQEQAP